MKVTYICTGAPSSDFSVLERARIHWMLGKDIETSSQILLEAFRVLVKRGEIPPYNNGVIFVFKGEEILIKRNGETTCTIDGFCDALTNLLFELIPLQQTPKLTGDQALQLIEDIRNQLG